MSIKKQGNIPDSPSPKTYLKTLLAPYKKKMMLALLIAIFSVLLFILQSYLMAQLFGDWLIAISQQKPLNTALMWQILPWLAVCLVMRPLLNLLKEQYLLKTSLNIRQMVRKKLLSAIIDLGPARHHFGSDGSLSTYVLEQVDELDGYISRFYIQRYLAVMTPFLIALVAFFYSPLASILMLVTAPLVPIFMVLVGSVAAKKSQEQFVAMAQLSGRFLDLLRGMPTLKRLNATSQALNTIAEASTDYQQRTMSVLRLAFLSGAVLELFASLAIALVAVYLGLGLLGVLPWAKGSIPVPYTGALFILLLAPEFYAPLRQLGTDYHAKAKAEAAVENFYPLLATLPKKHSHQEPLKQSQKQAQNQSQKQNMVLTQAPTLTLKNLHIMTEAQRMRLAPVSFCLNAKERVAIVGDSGSGKSSLLQAILGFVPFSGELWINQTLCTANQLKDMRQNMGYLAQRASLLPISIAENLRLAKTQATDDELKTVLKQVGLWQLIHQLPAGIHTLLGERGKGLSGGQQQRIAIAQLLLRNAKFWLLDEPCAHLDPETALQIFTLLGNLSHDKTVLLVSHDLSQVDWMDNTIQLNMPTHASNQHLEATV